MLIDARTIPEGTRLDTDVCIVGGGAAGITLAREFVNAPFRVCLLESGGFEFDDDTQSLFDGENVGLDYYPLRTARLRYFGGTTNHWTGLCRPLDAMDFESRAWVPWSGWPFGKIELDPYYRRAQSICELGPHEYDASGWDNDEARPFDLNPDRVTTTASQLSPPTRFGERYREEIVSARNCSVYIFTNVLEVQTEAAAPRITQLRLATLEGKNFSMRATLFVLACGTIENARLLLVSNARQAEGMGNQNDLVGRFFMEHLSVPGAFFLPAHEGVDSSFYYNSLERDGTFGIAHLAVSPEEQRREALLNIRAFVSRSAPEELSGKSSPGVLSAGFLWNAMRAGKLADDFQYHVANVIRDIDGVAIQAYERAFRPSSGVLALNNHIEQAPNPESRIQLTNDRDQLGMNRVQLDWRVGELERRTLARGNEIIGLELGRAGLGRVQLVADEGRSGWPPGLRGAWHQMGTTRMSDEPSRGVVDADCRVHGIPNLYVAGGSVFPTIGYANPTLTIVALAVRLADRLKRVMSPI